MGLPLEVVLLLFGFRDVNTVRAGPFLESGLREFNVPPAFVHVLMLTDSKTLRRIIASAELSGACLR